MRIDDIWLAGTGGTLGEPMPVADAVREGLYSARAAESTEMVSISRSDKAPPEMAVTAGRDAIKEAAQSGVEVNSSTLHLHSHGHFQGIEMWPAACWIAGQLLGDTLVGSPLTIAAASNGSLASLDVAAGMLSSRPDLPNALITIGDRFAPPVDRWYLSPGMIFGDGAASAVVSRGQGRLRLVSLTSETDTALEGLSRGDLPFTTAPEPQADMRRRTREFLAHGGVSLRDVRQRSSERTRSVVARALAEAGIGLADVDWFLTPFVGKALMQDSFLRPLQFTPRKTLFDLGLRVGHLGPADGLFALNHLLQHQLLRRGERILLLGTGMGFTFSAAVFAADGV